MSRDAPIEDIVKAYRRIMQRVHPDLSNCSGWFAPVAAAAYRTIRQERGRNRMTDPNDAPKLPARVGKSAGTGKKK